MIIRIFDWPNSQISNLTKTLYIQFSSTTRHPVSPLAVIFLKRYTELLQNASQEAKGSSGP